ncbi:SCO7613 C-terminal domain-containing membrane protein [Nocardiopsis sp. LOL_012]|uniref:SCO7613 C-terminal domain-containing membrane protein n=1 Tax=Nocardiopsis sp. LOL_012 TaxID=3345409 RepID=UPI003A85B050
MEQTPLPRPAHWCPSCRLPLPTAESPPACPRCRLPLVGPDAQELWRIDTELAGLDARRSVLLGERSALLHRMRAPSPTAAGVPRPPGGAPAPVGPAEVTGRSAQNAILGVGGLLVGIAALVFAVWTWSDMGTGARATVLVLTTMAFAGTASLLLRRGLKATAETFGALTSGLLFVDALALYLLSDGAFDGLAYWSVALALVSALMLLYTLAVPLAVPRILAVLCAQPVAVLAVLAVTDGDGEAWFVPALAVTALVDAALARGLGPPRSGVPVHTLGAASLVLAFCAVALALLFLLVDSPQVLSTGWWAAACALFLAGGMFLFHARRPEGERGPWTAVSATAGLTVLAAVAPITGVTGASGSLVPHVATVLSAAILAVGLVALLVPRMLARAVAVVAPSALLTLPPLLETEPPVSVACALAAGSALVVWSARLRDPWTAWVPMATGHLALLTGLAWALPGTDALTATAALACAVACAAGCAPARTRLVAAVTSATATVSAGAFALVLPLSLEVSVQYAALAPIAVAVAVAAAAYRLPSPRLECAEAAAALWAVAALLSAVAVGTRAELIASALAVVGVTALASAPRPRRGWLAAVGALLMFASLWTVLAAWDVDVPEAYTAAPAATALIVGWLWSRRAASPPSSRAAYGGGLALLLLPTVAVFLSTDTGLIWRLAAVVSAGLAVMVWGLRARLQAPLLMGSLALIAASLRAFGPPLWDLVVLLPNWVPFAAAGAVLLAVGARYEAHLARLRRWGSALSDLR